MEEATLPRLPKVKGQQGKANMDQLKHGADHSILNPATFIKESTEELEGGGENENSVGQVERSYTR